MSIILSMIVKDEAHVIERALDSVLGFADKAVIVDTGSTDETTSIIDHWAAEHEEIEVHLFGNTWTDFATNRNEALDLAREVADDDDLILFLDADDVLEHSQRGLMMTTLEKFESIKPQTSDGYDLLIHYGDLRYHRPALVRAGSPWKWVSPVHEYLSLEGAVTYNLDSPVIKIIGGGARSQDPEKFLKDAEVLEAHVGVQAVMGDPDPRLVFYLAQSYRDAGRPMQAIEHYEWRYDLEGGWDQERFYAAYQCGVLVNRQGDNAAHALNWLAKAIEVAPHRAEPYWLSTKIHRLAGRPNIALMFARAAVQCAMAGPVPTDLFVENDVYSWRARDEYAMACAETHREIHQGAAEAVRAQIHCPPEDPDYQRLVANVEWWRSQ